MANSPPDNDTQRAIYDQAWAHIDREEFIQAEEALRLLLDGLNPDDSLRIWEVAGLLASVLNSLSRPDDATEMYRRALSAARQAGDDHPAVGPAQYFLANQHLIHGDPRDALTEANPVPVGTGPVQCLLHSVTAQAFWKLGQRGEAQAAAQRAVTAASTDERRKEILQDLDHILNVS